MITMNKEELEEEEEEDTSYCEECGGYCDD